MSYQTVFQRKELKYLLTRCQQAQLLLAMEPYMAPDRYGATTVRSVYFDTDNYRLIRHSIEKPVYKEKLRIRSYRQAEAESLVFVELKKKYRDTVYKRRLALPRDTAMQWLTGALPCPADSQIAREIEYFRRYYETLTPKVFLSYDRIAYTCRSGSDLRITFDENVLARKTALSLGEAPAGNALLPEDQVLMEIKTGGAMPLWLTQVLTREKIYKASFSKYGTAYRKILFPETEKQTMDECANAQN